MEEHTLYPHKFWSLWTTENCDTSGNLQVVWCYICSSFVSLKSFSSWVIEEIILWSSCVKTVCGSWTREVRWACQLFMRDTHRFETNHTRRWRWHTRRLWYTRKTTLIMRLLMKLPNFGSHIQSSSCESSFFDEIQWQTCQWKRNVAKGDFTSFFTGTKEWKNGIVSRMKAKTSQEEWNWNESCLFNCLANRAWK